jgi:predicted amidohydrolase YtcJ
MAKLGVVLSAPSRPAGFDPHQDFRDAERFAPVKDYLDHHVVVSDGTDTHGYDRDDNPFLAFHWYVTRATVEGKVFGADQKISRQDALKLNTINGAYLTFEENVKGSIEPGKLADFVILNQDLMTVPEDQILATHALATYLGGKEVFSRKDSGF